LRRPIAAGAAGVAGVDVERERALPVAGFGHADGANLEAAPLDQTKHAHYRAFVHGKSDLDPAGHWFCSSI